ncbi:Helix-turn-helix [Pseudomonas syringae]|uniref:Helix-turn-helix n=2 Tax=Pseudomonas syringae TaxID=317 RepID=A0AB38C295_PSESX|nr:Helix-turn-helix [Pseudomonas syringae]SFP11271.1 Helix-turn-helix [Pseudomonas syringae]
MHQNPAHEQPMSIGENIKQKRESMNISQKTLADALGSGINTVASWEKDVSSPPGNKVAEMAKIFGCSTDEILLERNQRDLAPEMRALFRRFADLPDEMKPLVRGMMSAVLASIEEEASRKQSA